MKFSPIAVWRMGASPGPGGGASSGSLDPQHFRRAIFVNARCSFHAKLSLGVGRAYADPDVRQARWGAVERDGASHTARYITDNFTWHWIFYINVPVDALSLALVAMFVDEPLALVRERLALWRRGLRVDWIGFVLSALALGFLEIVLDKGQEDDWFKSTFIIVCTVVSAVSFLAFLPWELTREDPIVDISLIGRRQFGTSFFIMMAVGAVLFGTTQLMPQILQETFGYTATIAGLSLMPGGFASMASMLAAGQVSRFVQPRTMMAGALLAIALALYHFTALAPDADFWWFVWARVFQMVGIPFLFLTITSYSYVGLPWGKSGQASALINVARNLGGSIGISAMRTLLAQREQFHQSRLVAGLVPSLLKLASAYFARHGSSAAEAQRQVAAATSDWR